MDIKELGKGIDPSSHWYYQTKKIPLVEYFTAIMERRTGSIDVVDIGAGDGYFGMEIRKQYPENVRSLLLVDENYDHHELKKDERGMIWRGSYVPEKIENGFILLMDVLEHVEDDERFLREIKRNLVGTNYVFVTVPAFSCLWSGHDVYLGHWRRYRLSSLRRVLVSSGYRIDSMYYIYPMLFLIAYLKRRILPDRGKSELYTVNPIVNRALIAVEELEMRIRKVNKAFGLTCVAECHVNG